MSTNTNVLRQHVFRNLHDMHNITRTMIEHKARQHGMYDAVFESTDIGHLYWAIEDMFPGAVHINFVCVQK